MARPASNLHLQPKNGGWRARVLVPVELQATLGKKLFSTPVWRVTKSEAAVLAYPEVHLGIRQLAPKRLQPRKRPFLVGTHEPAVTRDIGGENGGQPAFDAYRGQAVL